MTLFSKRSVRNLQDILHIISLQHYLTFSSPAKRRSTSSLNPFTAICTFGSSFSAPSETAAKTRSINVYGILTTPDLLGGNSSGGVDYSSVPNSLFVDAKERLTSRNNCLVHPIASPTQPRLIARPIQASASRSISI